MKILPFMMMFLIVNPAYGIRCMIDDERTKIQSVENQHLVDFLTTVDGRSESAGQAQLSLNQ